MTLTTQYYDIGKRIGFPRVRCCNNFVKKEQKCVFWHFSCVGVLEIVQNHVSQLPKKLSMANYLQKNFQKSFQLSKKIFLPSQYHPSASKAIIYPPLLNYGKFKLKNAIFTLQKDLCRIFYERRIFYGTPKFFHNQVQS